MTQGSWQLVLAVSSGFILFVFAIYPVAVIVLSRLFARPVVRGQEIPSVSVLLPVRNGEKWIARKLQSIQALEYPAERLEVIVVSDGSTDGTVGVVRAQAASNVRIEEIAPRGKWAAINHGLRQAHNDVVFFTDVRQELDPPCLARMTARLADPEVGVVSGNLEIRRSGIGQGAGMYWRYEKAIRRAQSDLGSATGATGAIYVMRRELASELPPDCLDDDVYLPMTAVLRGKRVVFEDAARAYDDPTSLTQEFGRKVRTLAGVYQVLYFLPRLWAPNNGIWIHWWCHKMARLATPFALIAVGVSTIALLPEPLAVFALAGQVCCYGLAALDPFVPADGIAKNLSSLCRTFATVQLAALVACKIAVRPAGQLWSDVHGASRPRIVGPK